MQVILLQKVANLGNIGDLVNVKSGYGRNFLLPKGKATVATKDNVIKFEARRAELEQKARDEVTAAEERASKLKGFKVTVAAKAGNEGKLFGSIGTADIAEACTRAGYKVARAEVDLAGGLIRNVGDHQVRLVLHTDVIIELTVAVIPEE